MVLGKSAGWLFGLKIGSIPVAPTIPPSPDPHRRTPIGAGRQKLPQELPIKPGARDGKDRSRQSLRAGSIGLVGFPHECGELGVEACRVLVERGVACPLIDRKPGARDDRGGETAASRRSPPSFFEFGF